MKFLYYREVKYPGVWGEMINADHHRGFFTPREILGFIRSFINQRKGT